jgi:putative transcriptional regulator
MDSLQGHLLLASEDLHDPNFARSVVLLIEHNEQGALGVILNRPTSKTVQELWREVSQVPCDSQQPVCLGGPVSGPVMALHTMAALAEVEIISGVYFAAKKQHLDELVRQAADRPSHGVEPPGNSPQGLEPLLPWKVFVGHAGWGPGQLEAEIEQRAWHIAPATSEHIFAADADLWQRLLAAIDQARLGKLLKIKHVPRDPTVN